MHVEECLKIVEDLGFLLECSGLLEILTNGDVSLVNNFWIACWHMVWAIILELIPEFLNSHSESAEALLNITSFLVLERQNLLFDWSEGLLADIYQRSLGVLELDQEILFHLQLMLFQEHDGLFHWLYLVESSVSDHFDISDVFHDLHE